MLFCDREPSNSGVFDFGDVFVRSLWGSLVPAALVLFFSLVALPLPSSVKKITNIIGTPFSLFLTLPEAEAYDEEVSGQHGEPVIDTRKSAISWTTFALVVPACLETLAWVAVGTYSTLNSGNTWITYQPWIGAFSWAYGALRPILTPPTTPPLDLLALYILHFLGGALQFGGLIFDHYIYGIPISGAVVVIAHSANLSSIIFLLLTVLHTPFATPSAKVKKEDIGQSVSPEDYTSLWGWLSFQWVNPLMEKGGTSATLNESDVWELSPTMQSRPVFLRLGDRKRRTLFRTLLAANSFDIIMDYGGAIISVFFNYTGPFFLKRILDAIDNPTPESRGRAYVYAILAFIFNLLRAQADLQHLWFSRRAAIRIRTELMLSIYDKALKRKDFSGIVAKQNEDGEASKNEERKAGAGVGKIVNLMAGDATRIAGTAVFFVFSQPVEIGIALTMLYQLLGVAAFAGFAMLALTWPLNALISRRTLKFEKSLQAARDDRMAVLNELLGAVKFIKFFAWEDRWIGKGMDVRRKELRIMLKAAINKCVFSIIWAIAPTLVAVVSFLVFVMQGNKLTVGVAFTSLTLFNMIRLPLNYLPSDIIHLYQIGVAFKRIEAFLQEDEVTEQVSSLKQTRSDVDHRRYDAFGLKSASFRWNAVEEAKDETKTTGVEATPTITIDTDSASISGSIHQFELRDISVTFPDGELTLVTGPTASGKTALLLALLGEMTLVDGEIIMTKEPTKVYEDGLMHAISYAAQSPWLQHQSIKDNILFGSPYDEHRYNHVVEACALRPDLEMLEDGDSTEIGARGVSLSGGQKARVALARAVYARTKYVLLDDPLSAVDSHTARFIYERLLLGPLMQNRTVVLVTHHVELVLPGAYYVVRMLDGRIDTQGTVKDLRSRGVLDEIAQDSAPPTQENDQETKEASDVKVDDPNAPAAEAKKPRKLVEDEERASGGVKWSIYKTYLKASSYWTWVIMVILIVFVEILTVGEKWWIMIWGKAYEHSNEAISSHLSYEVQTLLGHYSLAPSQFHGINTIDRSDIPFNLPSADQQPMFYVWVYAAIGVAAALFNVTSTVTLYLGAYRASRRLFRQLLTSVVHATMRWHDVTPTGRMLNRFSKDMETIDTSLAGSLGEVYRAFATLISAVLVVSFVFPWFMVPATVIGYVYYRMAVGYLNTGRDLRRMESVSRSPVFSGFAELIEGIVTVRAFSAERRFLNGLFAKVDTTTRMWYTFWMTNRWLLVRFDFLGACVIFITTMFSLSGFIDAGLAGLCITTAMAFTLNIYWACRFWTELELDLNSVERVVEYLDLPQEPPQVIESNRPPAHWPSNSADRDFLVVENLVVKYSPDLPSVLHGVSFGLKGCERIGLLGRTGSGKSTLAMSILRFTDPVSGRIVIDGIDITKIGIYDLRSRVTFIPQDATLFSGTLRENLDPFADYTDAECLDVLSRVQMLADTSQKNSRNPSRAASIHGVEREDSADVPSTPPSISGSTVATDIDPKVSISLDMQVSAGGANFSHGQRQLIAMARVLLKQSSIIVLDEATSSIDFDTDAKIQATIREEFNNSLLLTVAHRLRTVIDYDRLIVLDKGVIAELDTPYNLIGKDGGVFRNMCLQSGMFAELEEAAKARAEREL
ncbi:multidrug resistance-associated ABC transporter [Rickenella mellea]|uniref:Multidrug resistance-associated ABC transporter n=1 Tax=Rickenella mellea TaxID=50990 RepID=A0A4Y7PVA5_9AGAM|nr:multidrug resistance-associated ABC transporter [Rickenella mellea]